MNIRRSTGTSVKISGSLIGQRISILSIFVALPRPNPTGGEFEEPNPSPLCFSRSRVRPPAVTRIFVSRASRLLVVPSMSMWIQWFPDSCRFR